MLLEERLLPVEVSYLSVDSRKRDRQLYPDASRYVVEFDRVFKDVVSVELVYGVYSKFADEDYVNLYIDELVPNMVSNCSQIGGSFTQLPLLSPKNEYTAASKFRSIKVFPTPLNKLSKFTIRFLGYDGALYPIREHMLRFEITCLRFHQPRAKNLVLTRDTITVWVPPTNNAVPDATNEVQELEMQSRAVQKERRREPSEAACRRTLGLPPKPFRVDSVQQVADAFKARASTIRAASPPSISNAGANIEEVKQAFKVLARKVAGKQATP